MVPPLEGAVGASRGQRRLLQPDKPWKRGGSPAPAPPTRDPPVPQKGSQASEGTPTAVQVTYLSGGGDRNSWLLRVPEAVRLDSAHWGTEIVFSTRPFPGQKAAAEGGWQRCWGEKGSSLWRDSKDRNSRLLHPSLTPNQRYI